MPIICSPLFFRMPKQLLITYDYELYLGNRSGSVYDCMTAPTEKLLALMTPFNIRAVFFVDTTCLLRLKENSRRYSKSREDFDTIARQLCDLVRKGHYVFPHIHPHWLDAKYIETSNQWQLNDVSRYRFHKLSDSDREYIFSGSVDLLSEILHAEFPEYKVNGYRAGGWCIQPFTDFLPFFRKHDMKYEFSVFSGIYQFTDAQYFDFSDAPAKNIYRFSSDVNVEDPQGSFTQFNINSIKVPATVTLANKIWLKFKYRLPGDHRYRRGEGQPSREMTGIKPSNSKGHNLSLPGIERISVEDLTAVKLNTYLNFFRESPYMHFISHPKMIYDFNLSAFEKFLKKVFKSYEIETDFHRMLTS